jgi:SAM-dependent methyltransferase
MAKRLLDDAELERTEVVANAIMNRQRNLTGGNSYAKELGFNPLDFLQARFATHQTVAWLDLCCGTGRALIQAAQVCQAGGFAQRVSLVGVDLVPIFDPIPAGFSFLKLEQASLKGWQPRMTFDLISCVHGLHYVGDKLGTICKAKKWLKPGGLLAAHLDYANLRLEDSTSPRLKIERSLRQAGFRYQSKRHLLTSGNPTTLPLLYDYVGADDRAGPNYTGQPAVDSYYRVKAGSDLFDSRAGSGTV